MFKQLGALSTLIPMALVSACDAGAGEQMIDDDPIVQTQQEIRRGQGRRFQPRSQQTFRPQVRTQQAPVAPVQQAAQQTSQTPVQEPQVIVETIEVAKVPATEILVEVTGVPAQIEEELFPAVFNPSVNGSEPSITRWETPAEEGKRYVVQTGNEGSVLFFRNADWSNIYFPAVPTKTVLKEPVDPFRPFGVQKEFGALEVFGSKLGAAFAGELGSAPVTSSSSSSYAGPEGQKSSRAQTSITPLRNGVRWSASDSSGFSASAEYNGAEVRSSVTVGDFEVDYHYNGTDQVKVKFKVEVDPKAYPLPEASADSAARRASREQVRAERSEVAQAERSRVEQIARARADELHAEQVEQARASREASREQVEVGESREQRADESREQRGDESREQRGDESREQRGDESEAADERAEDGEEVIEVPVPTIIIKEVVVWVRPSGAPAFIQFLGESDQIDFLILANDARAYEAEQADEAASPVQQAPVSDSRIERRDTARR